MKRIVQCIVVVLGLVLLFSGAQSAQASEVLALELSFDRNPVDVSQGESITVITKATGGKAPYNYEYYWYNDEQTWGNESPDPVSPQMYTPKFGKSGRVEVTVTDMNNTQVEKIAYFNIIGSVEVPPVTVDLQLNKETVSLDDDETITARWTITGGQPPYKCQYGWGGILSDPEAGNGTIPAAQPGILYTSEVAPDFPGYTAFRVDVTDSAGRRSYGASKYFMVTGEPKIIEIPFSFTYELSTWEADVKQWDSVTLSVYPSGGVPPYKYEYSTQIFDKDISLSTTLYEMATISDTYTYTPKFGQSGRFYISIEDSTGTYASGDTMTDMFTITGAPDEPPLVLHVELDKETVDLSKGEGITATWTVSGGKPPYRYNWRFDVETEFGIPITYPSDFEHGKFPISETSATFYPESGVTGYFDVSVIDDRGRTPWPEQKSFNLVGTLTRMAGDATNDGTIDILDLVSIIDYIVSGSSPTSFTNADANGDGSVDIMDLVWIIDKIVGG